MCEFEDVKTYLKEKTDMSDSRIQQCYNLIDNPCSRVNTDDEQWVACEQEHEIVTVCNAIDDILNNQFDSLDILTKVREVCNAFENAGITHKPRIPFYILVIDRLIA